MNRLLRYSIVKVIFLSLLCPFIFLSNYAKAYDKECTTDKEFCVLFSPFHLPIEGVRKELLKAKESIVIASYNFNIDDYGDILLAKANQGLKITYMIDFKLSFNNGQWQRLKHPNITRLRLPVFRGGNPQMHNKFILIDGNTLLSGSANYSSFGLIANFENILIIKNQHLLNQFRAEIRELAFNALKLCEYFAKEQNCEVNQSGWDRRIYELLTKGSLAKSEIKNNSWCRGLYKGYGLLDQQNQSKIKNLKSCLKDEIFSERLEILIKEISENERFTSGVPVQQSSMSDSSELWSNQPSQAFFSPEDFVEDAILRTLNMALERPRDSVVLVSTNFITNKKLAQKLSELKQRGVFLRAFFDRGRFLDDNFRYQLPLLKDLGFFGDSNLILERLKALGLGQDYPPTDYRNAITIFHNSITSDYGSNHNKWAIVLTPKQNYLINGSANWSSSAMRRNDENIIVSTHHELITLFAKEFLSEQYVYRYMQQAGHPELNLEIELINRYLPCLKQGLHLKVYKQSCDFLKNLKASEVLVATDVKIDPSRESLWAWIPELHLAIPFYSHEYFAGRYVSTINLPPGSRYHLKLFTIQKGLNPNYEGLSTARFEYPGVGNDRERSVPTYPFLKIDSTLKWGHP